MSNKVWRIVFMNIVIFLILLFALEGAARVLIYFTKGRSTVGLSERTVYLRYQPFVMFGPSWDEVLAHERDKGNAGRAVRILLLGGSTAELFPGELLEEAFAERFPSNDFKVINGAGSAYVARQEVIVASIWGIALEPDIIITLDGANDLVHRLRLGKAGTFFVDPAYEVFLKHQFLAPFAYLLSRSQALNGTQRLLERYRLASPESYADAVPVYVSAQHAINTMAKGLSATRVMVLQPFNAFKNPLSQPEANFTSYKYREPIIKELYNLAHAELATLAKKDGVRYLDGRSVFHGIQETIFSDDVHFADNRGYQILAKAIASCVREEDLGRKIHLTKGRGAREKAAQRLTAGPRMINEQER